MEKHGKQLIESNDVVKNNFNIGKDGITLTKKKEMFNELAAKKSHEFQNLKGNINLNNLIYKYKTEGRSLIMKFSNYENWINILTNIRDCNVNPRETLKN